MSLLLVDFEATGVDTNTARITEVGAMIVTDKWEPTGREVSTLVYDSSYPALTQEVQDVTKITPDMLREQGAEPKKALRLLANVVNERRPKFIVAYNREYDEQLFKAEVKRLGLENDEDFRYITSTPWICAMADIESNYKYKSWKLMHLALEYGVTVNPKELHRAINDVELTRKILEAAGVVAEQMYKFQIEPWVYVKAYTQKPWLDGGESNALVKADGYSWEQCKGDKRKFDKAWVKRIKQRHLEQELNKTYRVEQIGD